MVLWLHSLLVFLLFSRLILFSLLWGLLCSSLNNGTLRACPGSLYSSTHSPWMLSSTHSFNYQFYSNDSSIMVVSWPPGILSNPPSIQTTSDIFLQCKTGCYAVIYQKQKQKQKKLLLWLKFFGGSTHIPLWLYQIICNFWKASRYFVPLWFCLDYSMSLECSSYKSLQS